MPKVTALYRYPIKGFTPEACAAIDVLRDGRVAGDRVLGFAFANRGGPDHGWTRKYEFVVLSNTPGLARLRLQFDHRTQHLRIETDGKLMIDSPIGAGDRLRIAAAVQKYALGLDENPFAGHAERMPIRLIGDGRTPRHQDNEAGQITLHSRASLAAVAAAAGQARLDELRFRSNIVIEGVPPWEELGWVGRRVRIGSVFFDVVKPKVRCLAIHADPATGARDLPLLKTLKAAFSQAEPTFGIGMLTHGEGGEIRIGDELAVLP